jgi:hypothetical protein
MIELCGEAMSKAGTLIPCSQVLNTEGKFWKEMDSAAPVSMQVTRRWKSPQLSWAEDHTSHHIPVSQSLIQPEPLLSPILCGPREVRKLLKKS